MMCILLLARMCIGGGGRLKLAPAAQYDIIFCTITQHNVRVYTHRRGVTTFDHILLYRTRKSETTDRVRRGGDGGGGGRRRDAERGGRALDPRGADETRVLYNNII